MSGKGIPPSKISGLKSPKTTSPLANLETFEGQSLSVRTVTPGKSNSKVVIVSSVSNTLSSSGISQVISLAGLRSGADGAQIAKNQPVDLAQKNSNSGITIISSNVAGNSTYLNRPTLGPNTSNISGTPSKFFVTQIRAMAPNKGSTGSSSTAGSSNGAKSIAVPISLSRQSSLGTINMTVLTSENSAVSPSPAQVNTTYHVPRGAAAVANLATGKSNIASPAMRTGLHVAASPILSSCTALPAVSVSGLSPIQSSGSKSQSSSITINSTSAGSSSQWSKTLNAVQITNTPSKTPQFNPSYLQIKSPSVTLTAKNPRVVEVSKSLPPKTLTNTISNLTQNGDKTYLKKIVSPVVSLSSEGNVCSKTTVTVTNVTSSTKGKPPQANSMSTLSSASTMGNKAYHGNTSFQSVITSSSSLDSTSLSLSGTQSTHHGLSSGTPISHSVCVTTPGPSMPILSAKVSSSSPFGVSSLKPESSQISTKLTRPFQDSSNFQDMMDTSQALVKLSGQSGSSMTVTPVQSHKIQPDFSGIISDNDYKSTFHDLTMSVITVSKSESTSPGQGLSPTSHLTTIVRRNDNDGGLKRSGSYLTSLPSPSAGSDCSSGSTTISATSSPGLMLDTDDSLSNIKLECDENDTVKTEIVLDCGVKTVTIPTIPQICQLSPRKKPRKQLLMSKDMHEDTMDGCELTRVLLTTEVKEEREIEFQRPHMSLLHSVKQPWKTCYNHFLRHTDVKVKEDKKPSVSDLANQKHILQKASGWKMYHLSSQIENLVELEQQVWEEQSRILKTTEKSSGKELDKEINSINELLKGILQRSQLIQDQLSDANNQMIKITEHKSNVVDILNKYASKRAMKTKKS